MTSPSLLYPRGITAQPANTLQHISTSNYIMDSLGTSMSFSHGQVICGCYTMSCNGAYESTSLPTIFIAFVKFRITPMSCRVTSPSSLCDGWLRGWLVLTNALCLMRCVADQHPNGQSMPRCCQSSMSLVFHGFLSPLQDLSSRCLQCCRVVIS